MRALVLMLLWGLVSSAGLLMLLVGAQRLCERGAGLASFAAIAVGGLCWMAASFVLRSAQSAVMALGVEDDERR
jgi:hypothetical protein